MRFSFEYMKTKLKKAIKIVIHVISILFLFTFIAVFIFSKISGSPIFLFGKTTMWVVTDSMYPTIPARTYILVEKVSADEVQEGDIIAFISTNPEIYGQINTHRVIEKDGNSFITQGDNNFADDGEYSAKAENIIARYVRTLPVMTFIGRIVLSNVGFALMMIVFVVLVLVCYLPDIKDAIKESASKKNQEPDFDEATKTEIDRRVQEELEKLRAEKDIKSEDQ